MPLKCRHRPNLRNTLLAGALCIAVLAGCRGEDTQVRAPIVVKVQTVRLTDYAPTLTLTGEIAARAQSDLSFRITGRIIERKVDVGANVDAGELLARLEPREQKADVDAGIAAVHAAEAKLRQVTSAFERQKSLLNQGFTTRRDYDQAEQDYRTAQAALDNARAQLATARDSLSHAELRAPLSGVITVRNMEVGQVVQAAQPVVTLAHNGPRDAVVNVQEAVVSTIKGGRIELVLLSDPKIKTVGEVREVAPAVDATTGTVRVKIGIAHAPPEMLLGSAVTVTAQAKPRQMAILPWSALTSDSGQPAVWLTDPHSRKVTLRRIVIETFNSSDIVVRDGLRPGELVVTTGTQLLRPGQEIASDGETSR